MSKPKIGSEVVYTEKGKQCYATLNGKYPKNDGYFGEVVSVGAMNIVTVKTSEGDTSNFIWRFSDGLNDHFDWDGKK